MKMCKELYCYSHRQKEMTEYKYQHVTNNNPLLRFELALMLQHAAPTKVQKENKNATTGWHREDDTVLYDII